MHGKHDKDKCFPSVRQFLALPRSNILETRERRPKCWRKCDIESGICLKTKEKYMTNNQGNGRIISKANPGITLWSMYFSFSNIICDRPYRNKTPSNRYAQPPIEQELYQWSVAMESWFWSDHSVSWLIQESLDVVSRLIMNALSVSRCWETWPLVCAQMLSSFWAHVSNTYQPLDTITKKQKRVVGRRNNVCLTTLSSVSWSVS